MNFNQYRDIFNNEEHNTKKIKLSNAQIPIHEQTLPELKDCQKKKNKSRGQKRTKKLFSKNKNNKNKRK